MSATVWIDSPWNEFLQYGKDLFTELIRAIKILKSHEKFWDFISTPEIKLDL
jgi:hypothetical protein